MAKVSRSNSVDSAFHGEQDDILSLSGTKEDTMPTPSSPTNVVGAFLPGGTGTSGLHGEQTSMNTAPHLIPVDDEKPIVAKPNPIDLVQEQVSALAFKADVDDTVTKLLSIKTAVEKAGLELSVDVALQWACNAQALEVEDKRQRELETLKIMMQHHEGQLNRAAETERHRDNIAVSQQDMDWSDSINNARYECWRAIALAVGVCLVVALACDFFYPILHVAKVWWNSSIEEKICAWTGSASLDPFYDDTIHWSGRYFGLADLEWFQGYCGYCIIGNVRRSLILTAWFLTALAFNLLGVFIPKIFVPELFVLICRLSVAFFAIWMHGLVPAIEMITVLNTIIACTGASSLVFVELQHCKNRHDLSSLRQIPTYQHTSRKKMFYEDVVFCSYVAMISFVAFRLLALYSAL